MFKKLLFLALGALLFTGCRATLTNLTPQTQIRNTENLYPVEVVFSSREQALRWHSIKPQVIVNNRALPLQPTLLMTNRWEGLVPVPADADTVRYQYKFDYQVNAMGAPKPGSVTSQVFTLRILNQ